jgi:hypothetical protein
VLGIAKVIRSALNFDRFIIVDSFVSRTVKR